jgi:hypothetical protein
MAQQAQVPVGTYFGLPGFTQPFEQYENLNGIVTPLSLSAQTPWNPPGSFQKTDIVRWWELETIINWTTTVTGASLSPEAPYNFFQTLKLKLQGQYTPLEVESGFDAAFFQMYRPMRGPGQENVQNLLGTNTADVYSNGLIPQNNQSTGGPTATNNSSGVAQAGATVNPPPAPIQTNPAAGTSWVFNLEIPGSLYIDQYWDLAIDGTLLPNAQGVVAPMGATVSPQYMGGGERVVVPTFNYAAIAAANSDQGPLISSTAGAASITNNARRVGYYASANPAELPPVFNWQYRRSSKRYPIGAFTKVDIPVTEYGQLLSVFVRIFDPATGTGGTYYNVANLTKAQLLYGSNLPRFDDDVLTMQKRFLDQHGFLPPQGFVAWDMLANTSSQYGLSNDFRVLNTLTNANVHVHLETTTAPSASAYAVIGTELLVPVATQ